MDDKSVVELDVKELYLGNLGTVEFDLDLPRAGAHGSEIAWESDAPHFLDAEGHVNRPAYGRGNREITLTATFTHGSYSEKHDYTVKVLELDNDVEIAEVYPIELTAVSGEPCYLPSSVSVRTADDRVITQRVNWDGGLEHTWDALGEQRVTGSIDGTGFPVEGTVDVRIGREAPVPERERRTLTAGDLVAKLTPGSPFWDVQELTHRWLAASDTDQMLYNFRVAAGLDTLGAPKMIGWDSPDGLLRGHTTGHYLSGLAKCYAATADPAIAGKAHAMVNGLVACQAGLEARGCAEGFLSAYDEEQFDKLEEYVPYPKIWAPYYTYHKILAGLLDVYELVGDERALELADGMGAWVVRRLGRLSHEKLVRMWSIYIAGEYGGMNDVMARLAEVTGKPEYLKAAGWFDNDRLFFPLEQGVDALNGMHANQHIPQIVGAMEVFEAGGDARYLTIARRFWDEATRHHAYVIGGVGESEMFHAADDITGLLTNQTCESCASYNMLKLSGMLHRVDGDPAYMDYYERTLLNHTLGTHDHEPNSGTTYFISMEPGAVKEYDPDENSCCHGTGLETPFMSLADAYHVPCDPNEGNVLYVELFIPSTVSSRVRGFSLEQSVGRLDPGDISYVVECAYPLELRVRKPTWFAGCIRYQVDGEHFEAQEDNGYLLFPLEPGAHEIKIDVPVSLHMERASDDPAKYSVFFGPYVLAALSDSDERLSARSPELLQSLRAVEGEPMTFESASTGLRFMPFFDVCHEKYQLYIDEA